MTKIKIIVKIALNLLKNETSTKPGIEGKRLKAAWNELSLESTKY